MDYLSLGKTGLKGLPPLLRLYELWLFPTTGPGYWTKSSRYHSSNRRSKHHLEESVKALEVKLDRKEIEALEERHQPHPISGID
jgi:hypothetical protein